MESHLFGHVRGAFTGAVATVSGVFARAHTGTLFLDEIAEIPLHLQAKLLRVIQTREFTMVGGAQAQCVDVRLISATNRDLREAVRAGTFREDLYYRIAVVHLHPPPLRERKADIPLLIAHFLRRFVKKYGKEITGVTPRALEALTAYSWPGNVRQLENCIEEAVVLVDGKVLDIEHLSSIMAQNLMAQNRMAQNLPRPLTSAAQPLTLQQLERWYILETLRRAGGNRAKAARLLDISLRGLQYKLRRYAKGEQTAG